MTQLPFPAPGRYGKDEDLSRFIFSTPVRRLPPHWVIPAPFRDPSLVGQTPLHIACLRGNKAVVQWLVQHGADINGLDRAGCTPLMYSTIANDNTDIASYLLDNGAHIEMRSGDGLTALACAVDRCRFEFVKFLIHRRADVFTVGGNNGNLLHLAGCSNTKLFLFLLGSGVNPHQKTAIGNTAVYRAMNSGSAQLQSLLLNSPSLTSSLSSRPFNVLSVRAFGKANPPVFYRLLRRLSQARRQEMIHQAGIVDCNPLCEQTKAGNTKAMEILIRMGGDVETECPMHGTPAMVASNFGRLDILKMLVRRRARIEYRGKNCDPISAYKSALLEGRRHPRIVDWLIVGRFMEQPRLTDKAFGGSEENQQDIKPWSGPTKAEYLLNSLELRGNWNASSVQYAIFLNRLRRRIKIVTD